VVLQGAGEVVAGELTAFSNPTITGYKRLNANPLAPNRKSSPALGESRGAAALAIDDEWI
jgi:hypothetical protein